MSRYPLVEVRWLDAVEMSRTAGYLVAESDDAVTVAALVNRTHVAQGVCIPRRMISELVYLVPGSRRHEQETGHG